jgi:hypothetical protein
VIMSEPDATFRGSYVVVRISPFVTANSDAPHRENDGACHSAALIPAQAGKQQVARMSEAKSAVGLAANPGLSFDAIGSKKAAMTTAAMTANVHCYRIVKVGRSVVIPAGGCTSYLPGAKL